MQRLIGRAFAMQMVAIGASASRSAESDDAAATLISLARRKKRSLETVQVEENQRGRSGGVLTGWASTRMIAIAPPG
jgi:hypothetical protein